MAQRLRVSDYIARRLADAGVTHVFGLTGGGAMHLNDAFGREKRLTFFPCHHEQACAIAAEAYFRLSHRLAAVNVTSGPGGTNAITGVYGAYVDSLAMIVVSGNVKWETLTRSTGLPLRQLGDQEVDIVRLVAPVTKYAEMITDPQSVRYHVERALHLAMSGRPGPVWLDVPMNVQGAFIDPDALRAYDPAEDAVVYDTNLDAAASFILDKLERAARPVIIASSGIRISGAHEKFLALVKRLGIPVVTAWNAHDVIANDDPCYIGRPGMLGDRAGNYCVQSSDVLLSLGCRLSIRQVGYNFKAFARHAFKIVVDIDAAELKKPTLQVDYPVHADVGDVLDALLARARKDDGTRHAAWLAWNRERKARYPVVLPSYFDRKQPIHPYAFMEVFFSELAEDDVVVCGDGTACVVTFQAACIRRKQRVFHNSGSAPMGYDLPAAVGACLANGKKRTLCLTGDGSIMLNLQELQTLVTHRLPVQIFLLNNQGYHSIRQTQNTYFPDNPVGFDADSGVSFPDFEKVAAAFGIPFRRCDHLDALRIALRDTLGALGPQFCEIMIDPDQPFAPKAASKRLPDGRMVSAPLEDMAPFLSAEETRANLLIPEWQED